MKHNRSRNRLNRIDARTPRAAFTLVEIVLVLALITTLFLYAVPNFMEAQVRAQVVAARADLHSLAGALEAYFVDNRAYPPNVIRMIETPALSAPGQGKIAGVVESRRLELEGNLWLCETLESAAFRLGKQNAATAKDCPLLYNGMALVRLTTPVAYLGHLPPQVFQQPPDPSKPSALYRPPPVWGPGDASVPPSWDLWPQRPYGYVNFTDIAPDGVMLSGIGYTTAFMLTSPGPNYTPDFTDPQTIAPAIYDPVSGTVSTGDIVVFGTE